ncbi:hypothetical protein [Azospirillum argentinense]
MTFHLCFCTKESGSGIFSMFGCSKRMPWRRPATEHPMRAKD